MGAATRITWTEHTADELLDLARDCRDAKQAARAVATIMEGASRTEAAWAQGMELQILRDWVLRYNAEGFEGLVDRPRGGSERWLTEAQIAEVGAWIEAGPELERDGVTRWRVQDEARVGQRGTTTRVQAGVRASCATIATAASGCSAPRARRAASASRMWRTG